MASIALHAQSGKKLTVNGTLTADNATFTAIGGGAYAAIQIDNAAPKM